MANQDDQSGWWFKALLHLAPSADRALLHVLAGVLAQDNVALLNAIIPPVNYAIQEMRQSGYERRANELHSIGGILVSESGRLTFGPDYGILADIYLHKRCGRASPRPLDANHPEFARYLADPKAYEDAHAAKLLAGG